jgi:hypothetical protein
MSATAIFSRLVRNPYTETYEEMDEFELMSWKVVFEQSMVLDGWRPEKALRLRAINQALKNFRSAPNWRHAG